MATSNLTAEQEQEARNEHRTSEQIAALERLVKLAEEKGLKPLTREALEEMGTVWPADESVDEFLEARERWRRESLRRELP